MLESWGAAGRSLKRTRSGRKLSAVADRRRR